MKTSKNNFRPRWKQQKGEMFLVTFTLAVLAGTGMAIAIGIAANEAGGQRDRYNQALNEASDPNSNGDPNQAQQNHGTDIQTTGGRLIEQGIRTIPNGVGLPTTIKVLTTGSSVRDPRDNVRENVQSNVRETVSTTVRDNVKDNVKDNIKTGVKDTCSDGCKDTVKSNTRENVRSNTRCNGGGANCR